MADRARRFDNAMRFKTTAILLAAGLAAALFFFLVEKPRKARLADRAESEATLTAVTPDEVETVMIERSDVSIAARRDRSGWRITAPVGDSGDAAAFNTLVLSLCDATVERRIETRGESLSEYGLDPPAASVRLTGNGGRALLDIRIGEHNVTKSHCYARLGDSPVVLLVPAAIRRYSLRPFFEYRDPRVINVALSDVDAVGISSSGRSMDWRLDRGTRSWHTVAGGDTIPGDSTAVQSVVRRLRGLRARDIPSDGAARRDEYLEPFAGSIALGMAEASKTITLRFGGGRDGACYVERSTDGRIALVDTSALSLFAIAVNDLRYRKLLGYADEDLSRITLETSQRAVSIVRAGSRWTYENPGFGDVGEETARSILALMRGLRFDTVIAEKIPTAKSYGFSTPSLRLALLDAAGGVIDELRAGAPAPGGGSTYVTSLSAPRLGTIADSTLSALRARFAQTGAR